VFTAIKRGKEVCPVTHRWKMGGIFAFSQMLRRHVDTATSMMKDPGTEARTPVSSDHSNYNISFPVFKVS
jgi:hypothetical protein